MRDKKEWDEEKQEWVNRWGRNGKNKQLEEQWITEVPLNAGLFHYLTSSVRLPAEIFYFKMSTMIQGKSLVTSVKQRLPKTKSNVNKMSRVHNEPQGLVKCGKGRSTEH